MAILLTGGDLGFAATILAEESSIAGVVIAGSELTRQHEAIRTRLVEQVNALGLQPLLVDPAGIPPEMDVLIVGPGDPIHLARRLQPWRIPIQESVAAGLPYVGMGAGALIAGPSLLHAKQDAMAAAPPQPEPEALSLTDWCVFPEPSHDLSRHFRLAKGALQGRHPLLPLPPGHAYLATGEQHLMLAPNASVHELNATDYQ